MTVFWALIGVAAGACLGLAFFGGLWWTTHRLVTARAPGLLLVASLTTRLAVMALGLVLLGRADTAALLGALVGLIGTRIAVVRAASHTPLGLVPATTRRASERN